MNYGQKLRASYGAPPVRYSPLLTDVCGTKFGSQYRRYSSKREDKILPGGFSLNLCRVKSLVGGSLLRPMPFFSLLIPSPRHVLRVLVPPLCSNSLERGSINHSTLSS